MKETQLTDKERSVVQRILNKCKETMIWNGEENWFEDNGNFVVALDRTEMLALSEAVTKI